jgi:peptide chain release factor subunit 1
MKLEQTLERLSAFEPIDLPVISLYLNAQADQQGRHNFDVFVRKELPERAKTYPLHSRTRESFDEDLVRINRYLEQEVRPPTQGIAIFSCAGAKDFFVATQLEVPINRNRVFVYDRPHLYPLARLMDQYRAYAVLLADTNAARIFVFALGHAIDHKEVQNIKTKRTQVGGWSQMRYQRHTENYHLHHAQEVIETLERVVREDHIDHVILSGDETTIVPILREQMPKEISEKVIDVLNLGIESPEHEILQASLEAFRRHDAKTDAEKVDRLLNDYRAGGLAVAGVADTLAALSNGQVEELLISASPNNIDYRATDVSQVLAAYGSTPAAGTVRVLDPRIIADELVSRAQQISSARVTFIEDPTLLQPVGGVGGFLRYRV